MSTEYVGLTLDGHGRPSRKALLAALDEYYHLDNLVRMLPFGAAYNRTLSQRNELGQRISIAMAELWVHRA